MAGHLGGSLKVTELVLVVLETEGQQCEGPVCGDVPRLE